MLPADHSPGCRDPFDDAVERLLDGNAEPRDGTILNETLRLDPEARRRYVRAMLFEGMLAAEFAPVAGEAPAAAAVPSSGWKSLPWLASLAAAIILGAFLGWFLPGPSGRLDESAADDDPTDLTHAVVSTVDGAQGRIGGTALAAGLRLPNGFVELDSGLAEITFDSGAEITLEGPARMLLESANRSRLDKGRASAVVPEQASGFVIHTPTSFIREMGTTLAIEVLDDSQTDLHVLAGEVEAAPIGRNAHRLPKVLRQNDAMRFAKDGMRPIRFRADVSPAAKMKRVNRVPPSVHWSFDSWNGAVHSASASGHALEFHRNDRPAPPDLIDGPFGSALRLDGHAAYALSDYPGIGGSQPRTVSCWVRLAPDTPSGPGTPNGIVSWGVNRNNAKWQIGWNKAAPQGNPGAPRVEFGNGHVVGSSDLRDGRWHHLAVVYLGGSRADVSTHVRIYLDGRLEPLSGRLQRKIRTDTRSGEARPLAVGRYLGHWKNRGPFYFEGDLDELHVFEGALLPKQIVQLMKHNSVRIPTR
jgi:ferric-dicitrate binding protein FerR (iron transport regulator)